MEFQTNFKFLNWQEIFRRNSENLKEGDKSFIKLNVLDSNNNPCSFMVFNKEIKDKLFNLKLLSLQDLLITFKLNYNNSWIVNLSDIDII